MFLNSIGSWYGKLSAELYEIAYQGLLKGKYEFILETGKCSCP